MSIRIRSKSLQAATPGGPTVPADGFLDKIVKSIPSQVIAFYTAALVWLGAPAAGGEATSSVATVPTAPNTKLWIPFVLGLVLTPVLTWRQTHETGKPPAYIQIIVATVSFLVWAFATGGPFAGLAFWDANVSMVVLAAYTVLLGVIPQN